MNRSAYEQEAAKTLTVKSPAFEHGAEIPARHTCDGMDASPPLRLENTPPEAAALALILEDPDAPRGTFTHWIAWNVPPDVGALPESVDLEDLGAHEGKNDFGENGYRGPCPPEGRHRYFLRAYALDRLLDLPTGARRRDLENALENRVLAWGELMGTYGRE